MFGLNHALKTRPISELIPSIVEKEYALKSTETVPRVVICGAGAAGTELAFAFKERWDLLFNADIKITLISSRGTVLPRSDPSVIKLVT